MKSKIDPAVVQAMAHIQDRFMEMFERAVNPEELMENVRKKFKIPPSKWNPRERLIPLEAQQQLAQGMVEGGLVLAFHQCDCHIRRAQFVAKELAAGKKLTPEELKPRYWCGHFSAGLREPNKLVLPPDTQPGLTPDAPPDDSPSTTLNNGIQIQIIGEVDLPPDTNLNKFLDGLFGKEEPPPTTPPPTP